MSTHQVGLDPVTVEQIDELRGNVPRRQYLSWLVANEMIRTKSDPRPKPIRLVYTPHTDAADIPVDF